MAYAHTRLTEITTIANSAGALYTKAAGTTVYVRLIVLHNGNTTAEAVKIYVVPDSGGSAGTAGTTNEVYAETIEAGGTRILDFGAQGIMLKDNGETIQGVTTTASKVTFQAFGGVE